MNGMATYSAICDSKETEKHILISSRGNLRHHGLSICIIRSLKQAKEDIINPKISDVMVSYAVGPQTQHAIEWDENTECVCHHKHILRLDAEVFLEVPETEG